MKALIFAGGVGTRLWPLSRRNSPKQFEKVIGDKSTLQLSAERLLPEFSWSDIYLSTNQKYLSYIHEQLPQLPDANIILEPEARDVGPAVALAMTVLSAKHPHEPVVILWSDHHLKKMQLFKSLLPVCADRIVNNPHLIIFISQKPRFASQNLGWIRFGPAKHKKGKISFHSFSGFRYRPSLPEAEEFFRSGQYAWNTGYFVTTPAFILSLYKKLQPDIYRAMEKIKKAKARKEFADSVAKIYPRLPKISFDNCILEKIEEKNALVIPADLEWSDIGAWEALKEALQTSRDKNVVKGKVVVTDCQDSLIYNYTDKLVVTIDLDGHLVVNTKDVVLVCHKNSVPKIKQLVEKLSNSEDSHLV